MGLKNSRLFFKLVAWLFHPQVNRGQCTLTKRSMCNKIGLAAAPGRNKKNDTSHTHGVVVGLKAKSPPSCFTIFPLLKPIKFPIVKSFCKRKFCRNDTPPKWITLSSRTTQYSKVETLNETQKCDV